MYIAIIAICAIGIVLCLYKLFFQFMDTELKFLFVIGCFVITLILGMTMRDSYLEKTAEVITTILGVGKVIRVEEHSEYRESAIKYTVLRLNHIDYRCLGYVDGAKELRIIRSQNSYTLASTYNCESL